VLKRTIAVEFENLVENADFMFRPAKTSVRLHFLQTRTGHLLDFAKEKES
jgi:hypothetical protein